MAKKSNQACVLAINGGSSSIKFELHQIDELLFAPPLWRA
jgi:acetate kinase